jgi:signal transduction histidine kinase/CheY-like chemotaxis protein
MATLLRPAALFMNRLRYPAKFSLIGLLFLLPLAVVMCYFQADVSSTITFARAERQGLAISSRVSRLYIDLIRNSDTIINTDRLPLSAVTPVQHAIDVDIAGVDHAIDNQPDYKVASADWPDINRYWADLKRAPGSSGPDERQAAYERLLIRIVDMIGDVGVDSKLVLDPKPASYYVMDTTINQTPMLLLNYAYAQQIAHRIRISSPIPLADVVELSKRDANISTATQSIQADLNQAYVAHAELSASLDTKAQALYAGKDAYTKLIETRIVADGTRRASAKEVFESGETLLNAAVNYSDAASGVLDHLLKQRIDTDNLGRITVDAMAAISLLLAAYFFGGFYVGTLDGMRRLLSTAHRIARGDFRDAAEHSPDEVGDIAAELEATMRRRTDDLIEARNAAEAANVAKTHFLANMNHELRTPLNAVLGFSQLMQSDPNLTFEQRNTLDIINRSGEHLLGLINNILDLARIEAGKVTIETAAFDLSRTIRDLINMLRIRASEKDIDLIYDDSSQFPQFIRSDQVKIRQILINLIGNAIKYTERGATTLHINSERINAVSCVLVFDVIDTGIGIAEADYARIFEPFVQVGSLAEIKGTGLGLAITKQYIELMNASIEVRSRPGKGTGITVRIPVEIAAPGEVHVESVAPGSVIGIAEPPEEIRVLIVEDQIENSMLLERMLVNAGFRVKTAADGRAGVDIYRWWRPHFIWMDRRMPVMDGNEATRLIREMPGGADVKIAGLSASTLVDQRAESLAAGMDDFVAKPYRPDEIFECMARHLGIRYVYDTIERAESGLVRLKAEDLHRVPESRRRALADAVVSLDMHTIAAAIDIVAEVDPVLGRTLAEHADRFAYTSILKALNAASAFPTAEETR